ncbi:MAG: hypothetical protein ABIG95_06220 [Candidatus Woesearchaeota archaeon]
MLAIGDCLAAAAIWVIGLTPWSVPKTLAFYLAGYLILKGGFFALGGNIVSFLDVGCGFYLILLSLGHASSFLTLFAVIFLIQKNILVFFT